MTREQIKAAMAEIITIADAAGGIMTPEQQAAFDKLEAQYSDILQSDARREKLAKIEAAETASRGRSAGPLRIEHVKERVEDDPRCGFKNLADFAKTVRDSTIQGGSDDMRLRILQAPTNVQKGYAEDGGYLVPVAMRQEIWADVYDRKNSLVSMLNQEPTESNAVQLGKDETTPWGSTGVKALWRSEASQMTPSSLDLSGKTVRVESLYAFVNASDELIQDAPRLNARLTTGAADAINWKLGDAAVYGNGVGQPLGWFTSSAKVSVAKESGQAADSIVAKNVAKMYARMLPAGMPRAFWIINPDVLPDLLTMTLGNSATAFPIYTPPTVDAPGGYLMGRPVLLSEHAKTVGDQGDIQFVDPMGYYMPVKQTGPEFDSSIHLYFDYGLTAFRWTFRAGGAPFLSAPVDPANGSTTKSSFVVLDARA